MALFFPSDILLKNTYVISGPGVIVSKKTEKINVSKTSICIIFESSDYFCNILLTNNEQYSKST